MRTEIMGPPKTGPAIRICGKDIDIFILVNDEIDAEIVRLAMAIAERRRYAIMPANAAVVRQARSDCPNAVTPTHC